MPPLFQPYRITSCCCPGICKLSWCWWSVAVTATRGHSRGILVLVGLGWLLYCNLFFCFCFSFFETESCFVSRLECSGMILAHCSLYFPSGGTTSGSDYRRVPHAWLIFVFSVEMGSHYVAQAGLQLEFKWSAHLRLPKCWDYRCEPPHLAPFEFLWHCLWTLHTGPRAWDPCPSWSEFPVSVYGAGGFAFSAREFYHIWTYVIDLGIILF